jgi:hypothetical protein
MRSNFLIQTTLLVFALIGLTVRPCIAQNTFNYVNPPNGVPFQIQPRNFISCNSSGEVFVGFSNVGLGKFDGTNWELTDTSNSILPSNNVTAIAYPNNDLCVGTTKGLAIWSSGSWTVYDSTNSALPGNNIKSLYSNGNDIWIGTNFGLVKFNGNFSVFNTSNGLLNDTIIKITGLPDGSKIWAACRTGIMQIENGVVTNFSSLNSNLPASNIKDILYHQNNLWIGTQTQKLWKYNGTTFSQFNDVLNPLNAYVNFIIAKKGTNKIAVLGVWGFIEIDENNNSIGYQGSPPSGGIPARLMGTYDQNSNLFWLTYIVPSPTYLGIWNYSPSQISSNNLSDGQDFDASNTTLDINQISALVRNRGEMFWNRGNGQSGYYFPKNSTKTCSFSSGLWMGGIDQGGTLHLAAQTYRQTGNDFWPGPLSPTSGQIDSATALSYDKVWKINKAEIDEFIFHFALGNVQNGSYVPNSDFITWPATTIGSNTNYLAPFVDVNNDGLYRPLIDGDYPKIIGDQYLFWVFNDQLLAHTESGGNAFGVEIQASAWAYNCDQLPDSLKAINASTFYRYKIINRSSNDYSNMVLGTWNDFDLGAYDDDGIGTDSLNNSVFAFNLDSLDALWNGYGYGTYIPIVSQTILDGPLANPGDGIDNNNNNIVDEPGEKALLGGSIAFLNSNAQNGNPSNANQFNNYLHERFRDSTHQTYGGTGYGGSVPSRFAFYGEPWNVADWVCSSPFDWRIVANQGTFSMASGDTVVSEFCLIVSLDSSLIYGTQAYFEHATNDRRNISNWYQSNGQLGCSSTSQLIALSSPELTICGSNNITLTINSNASFNAGNGFIIQAESIDFGFGTPVNIDTIFTTQSNLNYSLVLPAQYLGAGDIKIRVFSTNPAIFSNELLFHLVNLPIPTHTISNNALNNFPLSTSFTNTTVNASNFDFLWSFGDGSIVQDNNTLVSHTYLNNGVYNTSLTILDPNSGCEASNFDPGNAGQTVICNMAGSGNCGFTPNTLPTGVVNGCLGGTVSLLAQNFPSASLLQWNRNGIPIGGEVFANLMVSISGYYTITATDTNGCAVTSAPVQVNFSLPAQTPPAIAVVGGNGVCGQLNATLTASGSFASYLWSNGQSGASINVSIAGSYSVTGQGAVGCDAVSLPVNISSSSVPSPEICMITVDPFNNHHIVVWEKPLTAEIDSFYVYRESPYNSGNYQKIAAVDYDDLSEYEDASSNAGIGPDRYKISVKDTCGGESAPSDFVRSIHLQVGPGIGTARFLSWSEYQGQSQNVSRYIILSGSSLNNLTEIDSVSAPISYYIDNNPVVGLNTIYLVEAVLSSQCESSRAQRTRSRSNGTGNNIFMNPSGLPTMQNENLFIQVFPNPNNGNFEMVLSNIPDNGFQWWLEDVMGRKITETGFSNLQRLNCSVIVNQGVYILKIKSGTNIYQRKIVFQQ